MIARRVAAAALLAVLAGPAAAQQEPTAADFVAICESDATAMRGACGSFLAGLVEVYVLIGTKDQTRRAACPPRMLSPDEMRNVFLAWAVPRSDLGRLSVPEAAAMAIRDRFPCSEIVVPPRK